MRGGDEERGFYFSFENSCGYLVVPLPQEEFECLGRADREYHAANKEDVAHGDQGPIEEHEHAEEGQHDAERRETDTDFCVFEVRVQEARA